VHHPKGGGGRILKESRPPRQRPLQAPTEKGRVHRLIDIPRAQPDADLGSRTVTASGKELSFAAEHVDHVPSSGGTLYAGYRPGEDPGMTLADRFLPAGLEHDAWVHSVPS
jgi:hypothetical protein